VLKVTIYEVRKSVLLTDYTNICTGHECTRLVFQIYKIYCTKQHL